MHLINLRAVALSVLIAGLFEAQQAAAAPWAVIVSGSKGFFNYRHQADACHAYSVLIKRGVPADHIITMIYDDVASSFMNPFPNQLFNKPTTGDKFGVDVNLDCVKDYTGRAVTPENFFNVLTGNKAAAETATQSISTGTTSTGRVLESTAEDNVFINFIDHGAPGFVSFPRQVMYAKDLINALTEMHTKKMYKQLVYYLEACESGSMFADLPADMNIFATTAANAQESSWGTYCPPHDYVNGKAMNTCLGDLYSVNWMEDADLENPVETLEQQFLTVKEETSKSHVLQFGDVTEMGPDPVAQFIGGKTEQQQEGGRPQLLRQKASRSLPILEQDSSTTHKNIKHESAVDSRDVPLVSMFYQYMRDPTDAHSVALTQHIQERQTVDRLFAGVTHRLVGSVSKTAEQVLRGESPEAAPPNWECVRQTSEKYVEMCTDGEGVGWTDYSMKYAKSLHVLCQLGHGVTDIHLALEAECVAVVG